MTKDNFKILIIDDEQVVVDSFIKICSLEGYNTKYALNAEDGIKLLTKEKYDLIICDIMLPEMDGFQFLDDLHSRKIETPVIMTTGYSTVENAVKSLNLGAIDYLPKPFTVDEVLGVLQRAINYIDIKQKVETTDSSTIVYVECPSKYHRLGFSSWIYVEDKGSALIGVTDLFLKMISDFDSIEFKEQGDEIIQGTSCTKFLSKENYSHDLLATISGKILEVNEQVVEDKSVIEKDPYFKGWLYRIIPSDIEYEMKNLTSCSSDDF